jgi:hypothetical protein
MDSFMLRDEAAKERVRLAEEFLDPRELSTCQMSLARRGYCKTEALTCLAIVAIQMINMRAVTDQPSSSCYRRTSED